MVSETEIKNLCKLLHKIQNCRRDTINPVKTFLFLNNYGHNAARSKRVGASLQEMSKNVQKVQSRFFQLQK
jgi:hypothetical protein